MKLLRSRWASGSMAVIAVAVVACQIAPALRQGRAEMVESRSAVSSDWTQSIAPNGGGGSRLSMGAVTSDCLDSIFLEGHFDGWVSHPLQDPFLLRELAPEQVDLSKSVLNNLELKAVWSQSGQRAAVINREVYREGDLIEGCRILKIEDEEVLVQGPARQERLVFNPKPATDLRLRGGAVAKSQP